MPRRSARLRGNTPITEFPAAPTTAPTKLAPVAESDEINAKDNDAKVATTPQSTPLKRSLVSSSKKAMKTPSTAGSLRPAREEMHPSKAQKSTTKQPDSGLILGFHPVKRDSDGNAIKENIITNTPSKVISSPPSNLGTPSKFDFRFSSDDAQLSEDARKLMESVRDDVARIKAQMILDRGEQQRKEEEAEKVVDGRKIAKPKGKAGRYSDAHMAEFKKMDSIAGHASAFRAQTGRFTPVQKSLKRKSSKAFLEDSEAKSSPSKSPVLGAKRMKRTENQETIPSRIPASNISPKKIAMPQPTKSAIRGGSLMTPTRSSAARFATVKASKISMIPSLTGSPASRLKLPQTPRTDFNPKLKKSLPSLGNLKSILRRRQPLFSNDPTKVAAGTHVAAPDFNPDVNLENLPTTSFGGIDQTPSPKKRVDFTSSTKSRHELSKATPSPLKFEPKHLDASSDVVYPELPQSTTPEKDAIDTPTIRRVRLSATAAQPNSPLSSIPAIPHGIPNKERKHDTKKEHIQISALTSNSSFPPSSAPNSPFPKMRTVPHGISNEKRQQEVPGKKTDSHPAKALTPGLSLSPAKKMKIPSASLLAIPHGINSKKRQRSDISDDDEDTENIPPPEQRNTKRLKASPMKLNPVSPSPTKARHIITPSRMAGGRSRTGTPGTASKKSVLSLSRLNMLSKPKSRA